MRSPAFFSLQRRPGHHFRYGEQVVQVDGRMPAGVVFAMATDAGTRGTELKFLNALKRLKHFFFLANDTHQILHHVLESMLNRIRSFGSIALERRQRVLFSRSNFIRMDDPEGVFPGVAGSVLTGSFSKNQQIRERIPAEPVRAMQARAALSRSKQPGNVRHLRIDRKSTRLNSSHSQISYAVFCLKKKKI